VTSRPLRSSVIAIIDPRREHCGVGADLPRCVVCRVVVKPNENVVFRPDGRVQHVACPEVVCPVCAGAIRPSDPIRRDGQLLLHGNCWLRRLRVAARNGNGDRAATIVSLPGKILDKLQAGLLPDHLPEKMGSGFGGGHACDACDEPVLAAQTEYTYELRDARVLRLHIGCAGLWQAELLRRGARRDQ
jgi:hypothetical protein